MTNPKRCLECGAAVTVRYGPDIRFDPPSTTPMMWRAECSNDKCNSRSWTAFSSVGALDMWNRAMAGEEQQNQRQIIPEIIPSHARALYDAVNAMMAPLGRDGQIDTRAPEVDAVMNALHDIDGGMPLEASNVSA